jgi:cytochrome P450
MKLPPGPRNFIALMGLLRLRKKNPIKLYEEVFREFGDIVFFKLGPYKFAMLNEASAIEKVLQTESRNTTKSSGYKRFALIVGKGLLVSEGQLWKRQRRMMSWAFSQKNIEKIYPVIRKETDSLLHSWKKNSVIDLAEEMNRITLQIISLSLFGKSQLSESKEIRSSLQKILEYLQTTRHLWFQLALSPIPFINKRELALKLEKKTPEPRAKKFFNSIKEIQKIVDEMIQERKALNLEENFLDVMIKSTDSEDDSKMSPEQLRDEAVNMLIAGHETTANALTWTLHLLLTHPEILKRAKSEVESVCQESTPSFEETQMLPYLKAVFEESMRLYPPFWRISRMNEVDIDFGEYTIPKGTNIIASIYTIQRSSRYWENPLVFNPERFLGSEKPQKFSYLPFGGGPRVCIGQGFAMAEALCLLAGIIKNVGLTSLLKGEPEYFMSLTLQPKNGYKVQVNKEMGQ